MKLGRDTNSVVNAILSSTRGEPKPEVGMGITLLHWTDRSAGTITRVGPSGMTFWFREDKAIRTDSNGMSEVQDYRYEPGEGRERRAVHGKRDWKEVRGSRIRLGERRAYHDYSF